MPPASMGEDEGQATVNDSVNDDGNQPTNPSAPQDDFEGAFAEFAAAKAETSDGGDDLEAPSAEQSEDRDDQGTEDAAAGGGEEAPPAAAQTTQTSAKTAPPPRDGAKTTSPDALSRLLANATPEERAELHRLKSNAGRALAYETRYRELSDQLRRTQQGSGAQQAPGNANGGGDGSEQDPNALFSDEEWRSLEAEYPEVAKPIKNLIGSLQAKLSNAERELSSYSADRRETYLAAQADLVVQEHPDLDAIKQSPDFAQWVQTAPAYIQAGIQRNAENIVDGAEASRIIRQFKMETGWGRGSQTANQGGRGAAGTVNNRVQQKRQRQLEAATAIAGRGPGAGSGPPDDFEAAFQHFSRRKETERMSRHG